MTDILTSEDGAREWLQSTFSPSEKQWSNLLRFTELLTEENERQNLVSATTISSLWVRHIADSAQLIQLASERDGAWMDLGSGAGLPGLVIAILNDAPIILVESRKLRCQFLRDVASELGLSNVIVQEARLELVDKFPVAAISARAFAPLEKLLKLANRFAAPDTVWLLPKGRNAVNELASLPKSWQNMFHVEQSLTDADSRILVGRGQLPVKKRGKA
jgi:16S rRNA (guanine527-N7)-methyltransferase